MTIRSASWRSAKGHQDFHDRPSFFIGVSFDALNQFLFTTAAGDTCGARLGTPNIAISIVE